MKKIFIITVIMSLVIYATAHAQAGSAIKKTTEGTSEVIEGAGKGAVGLGEGAVGAVSETVDMTGQLITGEGGKAVESGEKAVASGASGISSIIVEPVRGLEKGLQKIDEGIKKVTGHKE